MARIPPPDYDEEIDIVGSISECDVCGDEFTTADNIWADHDRILAVHMECIAALNPDQEYNLVHVDCTDIEEDTGLH